MRAIDRLRTFLRRSGERIIPNDPLDMRPRIADAYVKLEYAAKHGIPVDGTAVSAVTEARHKAASELPQGLEERFWKAYATLSRVGAARAVRRRYVRYSGWSLAALLFALLTFIAGDLARSKLTALEEQEAPAVKASKPPGDANVVAQARSPEEERRAQERRKADIDFARMVFQIPGGVPEKVFFRLTGWHTFFFVENADPVELRGKLDIMLTVLSAYVLPMLSGLLGACAFVLREFCAETDKESYAQRMLLHPPPRLSIGLLSGLAVGWFVKPGAGTLATLSPSALAFVAGYGSDAFFAMLDKLVQAFAMSGRSGGNAQTRADGRRKRPRSQKTKP
jgi:hypothetical protein